MSRTLMHLFGRSFISQAYAKSLQAHRICRTFLTPESLQSAIGGCIAPYSKRNGPPSDTDEPFKTVSKSRGVNIDDLSPLDGDPNWELTSHRHNRFYLPNANGPAWQGVRSTIALMKPLAHIVNFFKDANVDKSRLEITCCQCPLLIRESLFELFTFRPAKQENYAITLLTLSCEGDVEQSAAKFVLAAREIGYRLISSGYWAEFLNPFSGRPYFLPKDGSVLYKQDTRFRGLNMRLTNYNDCVLIASEENDAVSFSGTIFCTAPNNYSFLVQLLAPTEFKCRMHDVPH